MIWFLSDKLALADHHKITELKFADDYPLYLSVLQTKKHKKHFFAATIVIYNIKNSSFLYFLYYWTKKVWRKFLCDNSVFMHKW